MMKSGWCTAHRLYATFSRAPRVAIVGAGPAGMYVCSGVLKKLPTCEVDVFDASPVPYGLIRYGVAPDHPEVKNCIHQFDRMFTTNRERLSLYCNVAVSRDIRFDELLADYDAVVLAYGARKQRKLTIPGIDLQNAFSGYDFVSWYNGLPNAPGPSLDCENAVVIGNGNVALDCCRILLSSASERLLTTDIPNAVLDQLVRSKIKNVTIVGRRGPLEVSFTIKELREQVKLPGCSFAAEIDSVDQKAIEDAMQTLPRPKKRLIQLLVNNATPAVSLERHCQLRFRRSPIRILGDRNGKVRAVVMKSTRTNECEELDCGLLIYSIGFENIVLEGVPLNEKRQIDLKDSMRVNVPNGALVYASGWCAHNPRGVILDTQMDSATVAAALCRDLEARGLQPGKRIGSKDRLESRGVKYITWEDWKAIDEAEKRLGRTHNKEREKLLF